MNKRVVVCLAAGSWLTVAGCGNKTGVSTDGSAEVDTDVTMNPPPIMRWEDVKSRHPEGATNPPHPVLYVNPKTNVCFKKWVGARQPVEDAARTDCPVPDDSCGIQVLCPEDGRSEVLIAEWKASQSAEPHRTANPPPPHRSKAPPPPMPKPAEDP